MLRDRLNRLLTAVSLGAAVFLALTGCASSDSNSGTLIVLNKDGASASLFDRSTGDEVARLDVGEGPHEVAVSPDGNTAVVCNYGQDTPGNTLSVMDIPTQRVVRTIPLGRHTRPHGIVYMGDERVTVTAEGSRRLLVVNVTSGIIEAAIGTEQETSHMVATTPDASRAFVANIRSGTVSAIDLTERELIEIIETGAGAEGVDVSPDGAEVWISNRAADTVTILDAQTLEELAEFHAPSFPIRVKFTPDGERVLVSCARSGDVAVYDAATREELGRVSMFGQGVETGRSIIGGSGPLPIGILIPPDGKYAYIANTNADTVTVIDLDTLEIASRFDAGPEPDGMAWSPVEFE
ncbi:MAG: YncE family protein [Planctomycetota bacterium]